MTGEWKSTFCSATFVKLLCDDMHSAFWDGQLQHRCNSRSADSLACITRIVSYVFVTLFTPESWRGDEINVRCNIKVQLFLYSVHSFRQRTHASALMLWRRRKQRQRWSAALLRNSWRVWAVEASDSSPLLSVVGQSYRLWDCTSTSVCNIVTPSSWVFHEADLLQPFPASPSSPASDLPFCM